MGLFGLGKKKKTVTKSIEEQRQMTSNPPKLEANPQSTTVREENVSFQVPDFSEEDIDFDLDLNEFLPDIRKNEPETDMSASGAEQQDLERIMNTSIIGDEKDEGGNKEGNSIDVDKAEEKIDESKSNVEQAKVSINASDLKIAPPKVPETISAKQDSDEFETFENANENKSIKEQESLNNPEKSNNKEFINQETENKQEGFSKKPVETTPEEVKQDIPKSLIDEIEKPTYKSQEKEEDELPKFNLSKMEQEDEISSEEQLKKENIIPQENEDSINDPLSADFNTDEVVDLEHVLNKKNEEKISENTNSKDQISLVNNEKFIEKEEFKHLLKKEDELNKESKNNQIFAEKLKKYNREQNELFNITEDLIQDVKSRLLHLDQKIFEINQAI